MTFETFLTVKVTEYTNWREKGMEQREGEREQRESDREWKGWGTSKKKRGRERRRGR